MSVELRMPALSPTMEKGTLAKWLVGVGDIVRIGDLIAEIETDKATMEFESGDEGQVVSLAVAEGTDDVPVGTVIATLSAAGEAAAQPAAGADVPRERAAQAAPPPALVAAPVAKPVASSSVSATVSIAPDVNATPLAKRIAVADAIDLTGIAGTGARGKIVKADLGLASRAPAVPLTTSLAPAASVVLPPAGVPVVTGKLSTMRKTIAHRLTESKQTVPHFYLTARCNLDALLKLRGELNAGLEGRGVKLSVNDMLIKAMALALAEVPDANVQFGGEELHRFARADIAMAVAIDGGLVTPVIRDAGALSLSGIARQAQMLAAKAREGRLLPEEYQGGTASLSNLGMFGIDEIFPVINPPQALIMGVGAGIEQPWKVDGAIALATVMAATASFDHRAIDGAIAARFMAAFRSFVESPVQLVC